MPLPGSVFLSLSDTVEFVAQGSGEAEDRVRAAVTEAALAATITATGCTHLSTHRDLARYFAHPVIADRKQVPSQAWGTEISWTRSRVGRYDLVRFNRADIERWLATATEQLPTSIAEPRAAKSGEIPSGARTNRAAAAEEACRQRLSELTKRPENKDTAFEAAKYAVAKVGPLSRKAFERAWAGTVPNDWKGGGRRRAKTCGNPDPV